jgi:hypothetical protein
LIKYAGIIKIEQERFKIYRISEVIKLVKQQGDVKIKLGREVDDKVTSI